ncbi:hypothetical protein Droror1_Dr00001960 [Drosera rotundifolia]
MASKSSNQKLIILTTLFLSLSLFLLAATKLQPCGRLISLCRLQSRPLSHRYQQSSSTHKPPKWFSAVQKQFKQRKKVMAIGLVNIGLDDKDSRGLLGLADVVKVNFDRVSLAVKWEQLFPEWIDEDMTQEKPECPDIPMPRWEDYQGLDMVVARVPCGNGSSKARKDGIRDVFRLQVNLVVANLVTSQGDGAHGGRGEEMVVPVVFVGRCEPMLEIFRCDDLLRHEVGKYWVYKPKVGKLMEKILMPVGTCELASSPRFDSDDNRSRMMTNQDGRRPEAYATMLHSSEHYVCGAIALAQSLLRTNTTKDLVLLADPTISAKSIRGLSAAGWKIKRIQRIRSPHAKEDAYNEWNYSKFRVWQLTEYSKIIFIDSDFIVLRNIDNFFRYPQLSAAPNHMWIFNSGILVIEPSNCTFKHLMSKRYTLRSYNGGDQGYLNEVFTWWHRMTMKLNYLKVYDYNDGEGPRREVPDDQYAVHYLGVKPWVCYKDYDCNWDKLRTQIFASDDAHRKWWEVYEEMPKGLKGFCGLSWEMDERLRKWREKAKEENLSDGHWKIVVKDIRRHHHSLGL